MSDEISLDGKEYISSKRASELSSYAQDYIGQLARGGHIDARRVGGLWYVLMESLRVYKNKADEYKPQQPERKETIDPVSLITFDGKDYISASRASEITGYHKDYVGQLARTGAILSRQVGNRWYIEREGVLAHKAEKDRLLGAVQAQSVGLARRSTAKGIPRPAAELEAKSPDAMHSGSDSYMIYTPDERDLIPSPYKTYAAVADTSLDEKDEVEKPLVSEVHSIPIHVVQGREILDHSDHVKHVKFAVRAPRKTIFYGTIAGAALTIVIVLSFGFSTLKNSSVYAVNVTGNAFPGAALTASAAEAFLRIGDVLERWLVPELVFKRAPGN
ncbi:hypothetical protein A3H16_00655 [Candidatus Kaiserbacteria bacterium RIFCSPLOWO2_12_FULL_53_8]|uniref:Uncharacterized protein n=2 Tax=Candidatus Kaiseribacteriota TaxID=1752734 RepID=A0A1F6CWW1_9BACT|nr:MAG: hypothetical protein A2851_02210 [Candidatus Kaiserbacteria bacterium RIFCSPHIGHO2_01_FULL_53_29]OGG90979.1 MAG: hypothetical protein A3H16_00655 [Candidatus Kaiserbacteria bacterium RIFCSPLOWO2_12_FULL_53_8]